VQLAGKIDWPYRRRDCAALQRQGPAGVETRVAIGLLLLIYGLSEEGVCERWVHDPYFQYFTGEEFFQHAFPHERSDLSHWRKRLGDKLELLLPRVCGLPTLAGAAEQGLGAGKRGHHSAAQEHHLPDRRQAVARGGQRTEKTVTCPRAYPEAGWSVASGWARC
jgi:hypothetical protein